MAYRPRRWARTTRGGQIALLMALALLASSATVIASVAEPRPHVGSCAAPLCVGPYRFGLLDNASLENLSAIPSGVAVDPGGNAIQLPGGSVRLLVEIGPAGTAGDGDRFTLYGLVDPTVRVPVGDHVTLVVVNLDDEVHDLAVTSQPPPFGANPNVATNGSVAPDALWPLMTPLLPAAGASSAHPSWTTTADFEGSGVFWYVCVRTGHAEAGMFGELDVGG